MAYFSPIFAAVMMLTFSAANSEQSFDSSLVESLLAMPVSERNATLKAMNPDERRGLWFAVKKEQHRQRGGESPASRSESLANKAAQAAPALNSTRVPQPKAIGTIAYDSGMPTTSLNSSSIVGNRFNTHTGMPVFASGSVSSVSAVVVEGSNFTTSSAGFVLEGPQTTMGGAMALFSTFTNATGATDTVQFQGLSVDYTGSSFYVLFGDFNNSYVPAYGTGTTMAQGHHGVIGYTGGMGPNITGTAPVAGQNAFIRVRGNIVPVELMQYDVD